MFKFFSFFKTTKVHYCNHLFDDITDSKEEFLKLYAIDGLKTYKCRYCHGLKRNK